jgi:hypothetical protein
MNHKARAATIVGRAFPKVMHLRDGGRVDMTGWIPDVVREVARGLRQVERDAHGHAIRSAANVVGEFGLGDRELNLRIARQILTLEKLGGRK